MVSNGFHMSFHKKRGSALRSALRKLRSCFRTDAQSASISTEQAMPEMNPSLGEKATAENREPRTI